MGGRNKRLSWNSFFFFFCQKWIEKQTPDAVICSVLKQAHYHFSRKISKAKYIYEVHQLGYYPQITSNVKELELEKKIFHQADLLVTTTASLKKILENPPYSIRKPIEVIPLAVHASPLPKPIEGPLKIAYIGQLYENQGIGFLLQALAMVPEIQLDIIGGKKEEVLFYQKMAHSLGLSQRVNFLGFQPPQSLPGLIQNCHAFVAPFENRDRMPYVAHTKLFEYAHWGRPILAPDLAVVKEHFQKGVCLFESGNASSLAQSIQSLKGPAFLNLLQKEIAAFSGQFSWQKRAAHYAALLKTHLLN